MGHNDGPDQTGKAPAQKINKTGGWKSWRGENEREEAEERITIDSNKASKRKKEGDETGSSWEMLPS